MNEKMTVATTSELIAMAEYLKHGYTISLPFSPARYDFIAEKNGMSVRVQVKHGSPFNNGKELLGFSSKPYERSEIDVVVMVDTQTDQIYYIPANHVEGMTSIRLRLEPYKTSVGEGKALMAEHYKKFIG